MKLRHIGLSMTLTALSALPASGALVISEALANEVSTDTEGEFFEIHNTGATTVDLSTYRIGDEETQGGTGAGEAVHFFPAGATIDPGETIVIAPSALRFFTVYGFKPDFERTGSDVDVPEMVLDTVWEPDGGVGALGNTNDQLILWNGDTMVDAVNWGNNAPLNPGIDVTTAPADGQSFERKNVFIDTDTRDDWQFGPNPPGSTAAQRSTPGVAQVPEPASLGLLTLAGGLLIRRSRRS